MIELFDEDFGLSKNEILRKLSSQLGADCRDGEIKVTRNDREFFIYIFNGENFGSRVGTPSFLEIKTKIPLQHPTFIVRKSDIIDWITEHVLFTPDYLVGDSDFDEKFYIKISDKNFGSRFFTKDIFKKEVSGLLLQGFDLLRSEDGYLKVVKYGNSYPKVEMINNAIDKLDMIVLNFENDNISTTTSEQFDNDLSKSSIKEIIEDNKELIFGKMDEKSIQRLGIVVIVLFIVGAIAYGRLIAFWFNPPITP